jgi:O-antigen/teichoic acid export membrane protein
MGDQESKGGLGGLLVAGSAYNVISFLLTSLLPLVSVPILLSRLGVAGYGLWVLLVASFGLLGSASLGFASASTKFISESRAGKRESEIGLTLLVCMGSALIVGVVLSLAFAILATPIAKGLGLGGGALLEGQRSIRIVALGVTPILMYQIFLGIIWGHLRFLQATLINGATTAALTAGAIAVVVAGGSTIELSTWLAVHAWLSAALSWILTRRLVSDVSLGVNWNSERVREILRYSAFGTLSGLGSAVFSYVDRLIVGVLMGPVATARYAVVMSLSMKVNQVAGTITQVLPAAVSTLKERGDRDRLSLLLSRSSRLTGYTILALAAAIFLWAEPGLRIWLGRTFAEQNANLLRVAVVAYALFSLSAASYWFLYGWGDSRIVAIVGIGGAVCTVVLMVTLIPVWGILGAVVANFAYSINLVLDVFSRRRIGDPIWQGLREAYQRPALLFVVVLIAGSIIRDSVPWLFLVSGLSVGAFAGLAWLDERRVSSGRAGEAETSPKGHRGGSDG